MMNPCGQVAVLRSGICTSVQDLGRCANRDIGVGRGGAMDPVALRTANWLVGNEDNAAGLEITGQGPALRFERPALIALHGARAEFQDESMTLLQDRPWVLPAGRVMTVGRVHPGRWTYLAVAGGIDVPVQLGGRGTDLTTEWGGFQGRALRTDDVLSLGMANPLSAQYLEQHLERPLVSPENPALAPPAWLAPWRSRPSQPVVVRLLRGCEFDGLAPESKKALFGDAFSISASSNRIGYRLSDGPLRLNSDREILSAAVVPGTMQLPPDGVPIVLLADAGTTGGYPRIAHVIMADQPRFAQLCPGEMVRFQEVSLEDAHGALLQQSMHLARLRAGIHDKFRQGACA